MRTVGGGCLVLFVIASGSVAWAQAASDQQPPPAGPPGGAPAVMAPAPPATTVDLGTLEDANAGRNWLTPTALTPPAGTWSFSDYELLLVGASYAVTDQFVISIDTMIPVTGGLYWGFASAKYQLIKAGRLRIAVQAGLAAVSSQDTVTDTTTVNGMPMTTTATSSLTTGGGDVGGALTYCLDPACFSHVDGYLGLAFAYQNNASVPLAFSGALTARIARHIRLLLEADSAYLFGDLSGQADGILAWYGLRFTSRQIGVDVGLVKPICDGCDTGSTFPIGFPVVSFTYRGI